MAKNNQLDHHGDPDGSRGSYPNETMRLVIERASCRSFAPKQIEPEVMDLVLRAGAAAASGGNLQPFSIIRTEKRQTAERLAELCGGQPWIAEAAANLLFCIDYHRLERWAKLETAPFTATCSFRHFWISFQDTVIAAQNICTAADAMGLGSVYIGTVLECLREVRTIFELPAGVFPVVLLSMGYPKVRPEPRKKLGLGVIVHSEKYNEIEDHALVAAYDKKYPQSKFEITEDRLATIEVVCRRTYGEAFARECIARIKSQGYISAAQNYFGLHYRADDLPQGNEEFLEIMEEFGFGWLRKYQPDVNAIR
ncbi:MAG: nitroreductase family protein [Candidatus Zixiibacteriota bacterium]|nr:MAG: nitroreductase family protein [candidate division Zixibacteria bacterium]